MISEEPLINTEFHIPIPEDLEHVPYYTNADGTSKREESARFYWTEEGGYARLLEDGTLGEYKYPKTTFLTSVGMWKHIKPDDQQPSLVYDF